MYWINSGYNCRVSDRGAHFFGRRPVLCNNTHLIPRQGLSLPPGLRSLCLSTAFNQSLDAVALPSALEELSFGSDFNQPMAGDVLRTWREKRWFYEDIT
jgi:hypothetical protein